MIVLNVGTNSVYFTLNEKFDFYSPSVNSYTQSYYVGKLVNKLTEGEVYFRLNNDTSTSPERYNRFLLEVTPYNVISSNQIGLTGSNWDFDSQWNYEIWVVNGSTQSFTFSSIPNNGVILESGRAFIGDGTPIQPPTNRFVMSDADGFMISTSDLINFDFVDTDPVYEESMMAYMPSRGRVYCQTNSGYDDIYSDDGGISWIPTSNLIFTAYNVTYSDDLDILIVAQSGGTSNAYSTDGGLTWDYSDKLTNGQSRGAWSSSLGIFSFIDESGNWRTSTDGINWIGGSTGISVGDISKLIWVDELSLFIAITDSNMLYSIDGSNWSTSSWSSGGYNFDMCWNPDLSLVMITQQYSGSQRIITSDNGIDWGIAAVNSGVGNHVGCVYNPTYGFISVSTGGYIISTLDLINFATYSIPEYGPGLAIRDIVWVY